VVRLSPPDDAALRLRASQTSLVRRGEALRLIALQPIESELDATEVALSRDLVRVLTHELMNSLTPVLSLSRTAAGLSAQLPASPASGDVRAALETVERRASGLMQFVERYRELSAQPALARTAFAVEPLLLDLQRLFRAEWPTVSLSLEAAPGLQLTADRQLLEHALINLLRNAAQACQLRQPSAGQVRLSARAARRGRVLLEVEDDGPGIPEALRDDVFLPFFTTRPQGSGVGLSLAKQIVVAHGGSIRVEASSLGGACLRVVL
jgi:signal transduction histidine kinase